MCLRCPFYGFRWPERSTTLRYVGGNECGLDIGHYVPCMMETEGRTVNYFVCPVVHGEWNFLQVGKHLISFDSGRGQSEFLAEWERKRKEKENIGA